jgi:thymidylate synthase
MNKLDKQYTDILQDILDNGITKSDRTGTGTISVFGRQIRHNMKDGFPLLTTKKMAWKTMVTELLWFLRGDTNIKFLVDNGCHIWNGDAYKNYLKHTITGVENGLDRIKGYLDNCLVEFEGSYEHFTNPSFAYGFRPHTQEEFINKIKTDDEFAKQWGELGPIYGKQWRSWAKFNEKVYTKQVREVPEGGRFAETRNVNWVGGSEVVYIDQIANLINDLKTNPDSRRLMVSAWNVGELDQMVLPPCHYGFQVYTRELSLEERRKLVTREMFNQIYNGGGPDTLSHSEIDQWNVPTRAISLMWNQRSVDTFLGLPFNIASYGLLLEIIAKAVNMVPDELIGNLGDVHLYLNHIEQAKEQIGRERTHEEMVEMYYAIENKKDREEYWTWETRFDDNNISKHTRESYPLPTLKINSGNENWHLLDIDDIVYSLDNELTFKLENYQSHPSIKAPLSN